MSAVSRSEGRAKAVSPCAGPDHCKVTLLSVAWLSVIA